MKKEKNNIRKELEELSPLLAGLKNKSEPPPFQTPEHYFHQLTHQVMEQVKLEPNPHGPKKTPDAAGAWWRRLLNPRLATAFAAAVVLLVAAVWLWQAQSGPDEAVAAELTTEEMDRYVSVNIDEYELEWLLETASVEGELPAAATPPEEALDEYLDDILEEMELEELEELL